MKEGEMKQILILSGQASEMLLLFALGARSRGWRGGLWKHAQKTEE